MVTAAGEWVRADAGENADLFWALLGGGGNFEVVTAFEYRLHALEPEVLAGQIIHSLDGAREVLARYRDFMAEAPDEVTVYPFFLNLPPLEQIPEELHGKPALVLVMVYAGDPSRGEEALRPLTQFGDPLLSAVQPMPYVAAQQMFDEGMAGGARRYSRARVASSFGSSSRCSKISVSRAARITPVWNRGIPASRRKGGIIPRRMRKRSRPFGRTGTTATSF